MLKKPLAPLLSLFLVCNAAIAAEPEMATFAGGCFWCIEPPFEKLDGVISAVSGFSGGQQENPSYNEVASGRTNHLEVVQVTFDPAKVSYETLLATYWRQFDPTDDGGSFVDRGHQYTSAVYYTTQEQKQTAEQTKAGLAASRRFLSLS